MAKVKFSALISEMRNKLNGSVFSRNRGGAYLRNKVTPLNPQTSAQVAARSLLTFFSQGWRSLTEDQRLAWSGAVASWSSTDIFGDTINPTGATLYIRLNCNISIAGGSPIVLPPAQLGAAALDSLSIAADASANTLAITFTATPVPADHAMVIESTANLSPGISNANSNFRTIDVAAAASASPYAAGAAQLLKFGAMVTGQKIFVRAKMIRLSTGETSQRQVTSTIVVA